MFRALLGSLRFLRMPRKGPTGFYAINSGRKVGVVHTWAECESLVKGFKGAKYKKFGTLEEAENFARDGPVKTSTSIPISVSACDESSKPSASTKAPATGVTKLNENLNQPSSVRKRPLEEDTDVPVVYTDGACSGNGQRGAKAGIGVYWGDGDPRNVSEPLEGKPTNNRAEIQAAVRAIQQAKEQGFKKVEVRTDSNFMIESVTKWIPGWQAKDWKTASGKPVINKDDFVDLLEAKKGIEVIWTHVNGHVGIHGNEMADGLAVTGMRKRQKVDD